MRKTLRGLMFLPGVLVAGLGSSVAADEWQDRITLNGFGNWFYSETDATNTYAGATPGGAYENTEFALVFTGTLSPSITAYAQVFWGHGESFSDEQKSEVELDVAAVEWAFHDHANLRFGRSRVPFGIYTEIWDAGIVRPFNQLPQSLYGSSKFIAEFYDGLSVGGDFEGPTGWGFSYDVYGGEMHFEFLEPDETLLEAEGRALRQGQGEGEGGAVAELELTDVLGARIRVGTPVPGLGFGLSYYRGDVEDGSFRKGLTQEVAGVHVEYLGDHWQVRGEHAEAQLEEDAHASYLEVAYHFNDHWQLAARWENLEDDSKAEEVADLGALASTLEHEEWAVGIAYAVNARLVLKASYHLIEGNHLALPADFFTSLRAGNLADLRLDDETRMVQLGVSFTF